MLVVGEQTRSSEAGLRHALRAGAGYWIAISTLLVASLSLRLFAVDWGIPNYDASRMAASAYRNSYHLDEDNYIWALSLMKPEQGNFDVHDYHWGTLQHYLIYGTFLVSEAAGIIPAPWDDAFRRGDIAVLPRLYILGRLVSVIAGAVGTLLVAALGRLLAGRLAGVGAATAYALAPIAVVEAHYLTGDMVMSVLVVASLLAATAALRRANLRLLVAAGILLGLASAAKYSAAFALPALLVAQFALWRSVRAEGNRRSVIAICLLPLAGAALGFVVGEPFAVIAPGEVLEGLRQAADGNAPGSPLALGLFRYLFLWHTTNLAKFGLTWPMALLALGGLGLLLAAVVRWIAGARAARWLRNIPLPSAVPALVLLAGGLGLEVSIIVNRVPMLRYDQPLMPLLAVAAGVAWAALPSAWLRAAAGAVTVGVAAIITLGQLSLMAGPHTANQLLAWVQTNVKPGQTVAQVWPEYPPLDGGSYRLIRIDPWRPAIPQGAHPDYIILDNMIFNPVEPSLNALLSSNYRPLVTFSAKPSIGSFTWDEGVTPHDWKYSHPTFTVYSLK